MDRASHHQSNISWIKLVESIKSNGLRNQNRRQQNISVAILATKRLPSSKFPSSNRHHVHRFYQYIRFQWLFHAKLLQTGNGFTLARMHKMRRFEPGGTFRGHRTAERRGTEPRNVRHFEMFDSVNQETKEREERHSRHITTFSKPFVFSDNLTEHSFAPQGDTNIDVCRHLISMLELDITFDIFSMFPT